MHIYYELTEVLKEVDDEAVVKLLAKNADDIVLKEAAIENLKKKIAESDYEYKEIQDAAVRFGLFLKKNSITPYNDAMLAYLDHLIKDEVDKVQIANGKRERLDNLLRHRREHVEQVKVLSHNMGDGPNEEVLDEFGVETLVNHLYNLKHWGKNLRDNKDKAEAAHQQAGYRERPYRPQGRGGGGHRSYSGQGSSSSSNNGIMGQLVNSAVSAVSYFAGNPRPSAVIAERPRRPYAHAAATRATQPTHPERPAPRVPGSFPSNGPTRTTSIESKGQVLRKPAPTAASPQSKKGSGNGVVIRDYVPPTPVYSLPALVPPDPPTKPDSLKSKFLRPFSKRY
jgi:hypothetical protein